MLASGCNGWPPNHVGQGAMWLSFLASTQEGAVAAPQVPSPPLSWGLGGQQCWCNWFGQHTRSEPVPDSTGPAPGAAPPASPRGTASARYQHPAPPWALCGARLGHVGSRFPLTKGPMLAHGQWKASGAAEQARKSMYQHQVQLQVSPADRPSSSTAITR